jgi:hypothetical protein
MAYRVLIGALAIFALACQGSGAGGPRDPRLPPGAGGDVLGATDLRLNVACTDTCCLADPWLAGYGPIAPDVATRVRGEISTTPVPRKIALGLRALRESPTSDDARLAERYLEDFRPAGQVPTVVVTQQAMPCYPVAWVETSPSNEAIALLSRLYARPFQSAAEYAAFRSTTQNPDADFDVWLGRLGRQRPAEQNDVAALVARGGDLFVRVGAAYCAEDSSCGIDRTALADTLKRAPGTAHAWLRGQADLGAAAPADAFQRSAAFVLSEGDRIFSAADVPALKQLAAQNALHGPNRARLVVLLSRFEPASRRTLIASALASTQDAGRPILLEEWAHRDPSGCRQGCAPWFFRPGAAQPDDDTTAIIRGLVAASEPTKSIFWELVKAHPPLADDPGALEAAVDAGNTFGCADLPDKSKLRPRGQKGLSHAEAELAQHAASEARRAAAARLTVCAAEIAR